MSEQLTASKSDSARRSIEFSSAVYEELQAAARKMGLSVPSYLMLLHAQHQPGVSASFLSEVREIFTQDREILQRLAE